jgi:hypothetical protein
MLAALLLSVCADPGSPALAAPRLTFSVFAHTGLPLGDMLWTGPLFVYTAEGRRAVYTMDASGQGLRVRTNVPQNNGEMRCILSPGVHGFAAHAIYCHAAQGAIYRIDTTNWTVRQIAQIPTPKAGSDGALTYDAGGAFGYTLLAATGGSDAGSGGTVYAVQTGGGVRRIGTYSGPGGAENLAMAPRGFGSAAGQVLITIDQHNRHGRLLAMDAHGQVRTLAGGLTWGLNPIVSAPSASGMATSTVRPGLYLADWLSHDVFFTPAAALRAYAGDLLVSTELGNQLYVLRPQGSHYSLTLLATNLQKSKSNYEGACFVAQG